MKHIKKSGIVMVLILVTALCIGCGSKVNEEKSNPSTENHSSQVEEETQATENQHTKDMLDTENNKAESIQDEIAKVDEQRAWIDRKEKNVKGAGMAAFGGSLQPQLENDTAKDMTRARTYILAGYLAGVRNENFIISSEIQESIDMADPSLNEIFEKFEGQWIFDKERGACVGVEKTETCAYGVEGSNWTVWVTGGDIISDLDVYGYTENNIIFKVTHDDYDAYYELLFNMDNLLSFAYGTSLGAMDDIIVCD